MTRSALVATAFRGDVDTEELRAFFLPERQFDGDTRWRFGTSLKSAYVNSFEFRNEAPIVQLWRDPQGSVQAVSRISLGTGEWFFQSSPGFRDESVAAQIIEQADAALELLTNQESWRTVIYESNRSGIELLARNGYEPGERDEVFMTMALAAVAEPDVGAGAVEFRALDQNNPAEVRERALAQVDAFSGGAPNESELAWIHRTLPHQLSYAPTHSANLVGMASDGRCLAFADVYFDPVNLVGEFEPVGTRTSEQRRGLSSALLRTGLAAMKSAGMTRAVVRTGVENLPAIAAYQAVGFEIADHRISLHRTRQRFLDRPAAAVSTN